MRRNKFVAVGTALLVLTAAGCSSTTGGAGSASTAKPAGDWGKINWQASKGQTLTVLATAMPVSDVYKAHIAEFQNLTGIKVNFTQMNDTDRLKAQLLDFQGGTGQYDVSNVGISNREQFAAGHFLEPLQSHLKNGPLYDSSWYALNDYPEKILAGGKSTAGDQVYLPFTAEYFLLWYRKDIFTKLNLTPPTNYNQLMATSEKLDAARKAGQISAYAYADRGAPGSGESGWNFFATSNRYGYKVINFDTKTSLMGSATGRSALQKYTAPIVKYAPPGSANWSWPDISKAFSQSQLAMTVAGNASYASIEDPASSKVAGKVGYAVPPMENGGKDPLWEWGWGINAASTHKDAAWLFELWATSKNLALEIAPKFGVPARISPYTDAKYLSAMPKNGFVDAQKTMLQSGVDPAPPMLSAKWPEAAEIISKEINSVVAKQETSDQASANIEASLKKLGYTSG